MNRNIRQPSPRPNELDLSGHDMRSHRPERDSMPNTSEAPQPQPPAPPKGTQFIEAIGGPSRRRKRKSSRSTCDPSDGVSSVGHSAEPDPADASKEAPQEAPPEPPPAKAELSPRPRKPKGKKLTSWEVAEMRNLYSIGPETYESLAHLFGVSTTTVANIIQLKTWKAVNPNQLTIYEMEDVQP